MRLLRCSWLSPSFTQQGLQQTQLSFEVFVLAVFFCHQTTVLLLTCPVNAWRKKNAIKRQTNRQRVHTWLTVPMLPYSDLYSVVGQYCKRKQCKIVGRTNMYSSEQTSMSFSFLGSLYCSNVIKVGVHYTVVPLGWNFFCGCFSSCRKPDVANVLKDEMKWIWTCVTFPSACRIAPQTL